MNISRLLSILILFSGFRVPAQQPCITFDCAMQHAKTTFETGDYRKAYDEFKAARNFKRADIAEVNVWIDKTFEALEKRQQADATSARQLRADANKTKKVLDRLYFYQGRFGVAYDAVNQIFGFMDTSGRVVIPFQFSTVGPFDDQGFAEGIKRDYRNGRVYFLIDTLGNTYRLAKDIGQLDTSITALDLRYQQLKSLPEVICRNRQLQVLLLNYNQLSELPTHFSDLTNLKILCLDNNLLTSLPAGFGQLASLQTLKLNYNKLTALPTDFSLLKNLESLEVSGNHIAGLPDHFEELTRLRQLHLTSNPIGSLPENFGQLMNLEMLTLIDCQLTKLPESFGQLGRLRWLEAGVNQLANLPESFGRLQNLRYLDMSRNRLDALPMSFGQLNRLQTLIIHSNQITALPAGLGRLSQLQELNIAYNQVGQLPDDFPQLIHLETFEATRNQIFTLPKGFGRLKTLKSLILSDNQFKSLPAEIGALDSLEGLYVDDNQLDSLPEAIGQLQALKALYAGSNQLATLPASLCNLSHLEELSYSKNPIREVPACIKNMSAQAPLFEIALGLSESEASDSAYLALAHQILTGSYEQAFKKVLSDIQADSTDAELYFSLSYYGLFIGQYEQAIQAAQKTLRLNPALVKVETNLALGYLLNNRYDLAEPIYQKWKGKKFAAADQELADAIFLKDIADLEDMGIHHEDFQRVKTFFSK